MPTDYRTKAMRRRIYNQGAGMRSRADWTFLLGGEYPSTPLPATEATAMGWPPFGRGVALLANAVAGTDWYAARWDPAAGIYQRTASQPAVVTDPDPTVTPWNYRWAAAEDGILYGNHFAFLGYGDDPSDPWPRFIVPVPADQVWLLTDPETGLYWLTVAGTTYPPTDLLHVNYGSRSGEPFGRGVLRQYCEWMGGALAAEPAHRWYYFAGGAMPPAVLQSPTQLTQGQADDLKESWRKVANTREPIVMPMGYVLTPLVSNAEQNPSGAVTAVEMRSWQR